MPLLPGVILFFALVLLANYAQKQNDPILLRLTTWLFVGINLLIFAGGLLLLFFRPDQPADNELQTALAGLDLRASGVILLAMAIWGLLVILPELRQWLARWSAIDPDSPVHTLALIFSGYMVGNTLVTLTQGGLENLAATATATSVLEVAASQLLFALAGIVGVGALIRRDGVKLLDRLGLEMPTPQQLLRGAGWVVLLFMLQTVIVGLWQQFNPEEVALLENINSQYYVDFDTAWEWFILALAAAIGEELLFRGALQPVFGLWPTALLFAVAHIQYSITPATAFLLVVGVVLGYLRRRHNTSVAMFVHFGYDFTLGMLVLLAPYLEQLLEQMPA